MSDELFTIAQAAAYLKVCDKTIRRMIKSNKITASKIGSRAWRIKKSDIDISQTMKMLQGKPTHLMRIFHKLVLIDCGV